MDAFDFVKAAEGWKISGGVYASRRVPQPAHSTSINKDSRAVVSRPRRALPVGLFVPETDTIVLEMRTTHSRRAPRPLHRLRPLTRGAEPRPPGPVAKTLFGQTRRQVLGLLFGRPDEAFYVREIARTTGAALGAVQRELRALVGAGILECSAQGRQVFYQANRQCPVFDELHAIVAKTSGLVDVLRLALFGSLDRIDVAFVYGSLAKTGGTGASDVDLFIIGEVGFGVAVDALADAETSLRREVNPVVQSPEEFGRRVAGKDHFVSRVLSEPRLFVLGDEDVLERLGTKRMAGSPHDEPPGNRRPSGDRQSGPPRQPVRRPQR